MPAPYFGLFAPLKPPDPLRPDADRRPPVWVRLRVRWNRQELDAALADGADPASSDELALRGQQLAEPETRQRIASGIENLFRLATKGPGAGATTAMVVTSFDRQRVAANQSELAALAGKLRNGGPHAVRGLAMASILFEDPASELYSRTGDDRLRPAVRATIEALEG